MVLVITGFLVGVVSNLVLTTGDSQSYTKSMVRAMELNQQLLNDTRGEILSSAGLFKNDALGTGFYSALQFDPLHPPLASSKLPTEAVTANFGPEIVAGERTGNVLALVRHAWLAEYKCSSARTYAIDVYRILCFYLSENSEGGPQAGSPGGLNLTRFISEPLANGNQVDEITDPVDLAEVLVHLLGQTADVRGDVNPAVKLLWIPGEAVSTLREIDSAAVQISATPVAPRTSWTLRRDELQSASDLLEFRGFSVASNFAKARFGVGRFGKRDDTGAGFPHGFEIQVRGSKTSRSVLVHLSLAGSNRKGLKAHSDLKTVVMMRDM